MAIFLKDYDLHFITVPKVACTSFKDLFFQIENGFEFREFQANGHTRDIHDAAYPGKPYRVWSRSNPHSRHRITIIRDPIKRFISAYSNRVIHYRQLSEETMGDVLKKYRLPCDPDLSTFVDNFSKYYKISGPINWHTRPLTDWLGKNKALYQAIFRFDQIDDCVNLIQEITNTNYSLQHMQTGGPKISSNELSSKQISKLERFYANDFKYFKEYF